MCGRVTQFSRWTEVVRAVGLVPPVRPARYNLSPGTSLLAVRREQGEWRAEALDWGFVPAWAAPDADVAGQANARAEGVFDRPVFRDAARLRRCLVPVDGYYEWKTEGRQKTPYYFRAADGGPLALAGLWSFRPGADGAHRRTLCLVTTAPNREAAEVHGRMPVLVPPARWSDWLAERALTPAEFAALAVTAPDRSLACHRVSPEVGRVAVDDPRLVEPLVGVADQPDFLGDLLG